MARDLTSAFQTALTATEKKPVLLAEIEFASGFSRYWTGTGTLSWDGKSWAGTGKLGSISPVEENDEIEAKGFKLTLEGVDSALATSTLTDAKPGGTVKVWLGMLDASGALIADPFQMRGGFVDGYDIEDNGAQSTVVVTVEDELVDLERPRERRYTPEDARIDNADDSGFDMVPLLADLVLES